MARLLAMLLATVLFALAVATTDTTSFAKECPHSGLCFQLNIPSDTSKSGRGDVYFQIRAPTSYHWVALGQGRQMADANMFVVYADGAGKNVTLSTRLGKAHVQPPVSNHSQVTLLEGSGIHGGVMMANIRCSNCDRWPGGSMNFHGRQADWIYAAKLGAPLRSDDVQKTLRRHDSSGHFVWSLDEAKGGDGVNPFLTQAATKAQNGGSQGGTWTQQPVNHSGSSTTRLVAIHGALAVLVFVILFPLGGILIRLANFRGGI